MYCVVSKLFSSHSLPAFQIDPHSKNISLEHWAHGMLLDVISIKELITHLKKCQAGRSGHSAIPGHGRRCLPAVPACARQESLLSCSAVKLRVWSEITVRWVLCLPTEILLVLRLGLVGGGPEGGGSELWEVNCSLFLQETIMSHSIMAIWH